ncbi:hypothetical protein BDV93DRAFT_259508 [Ceratobasidium sp. AG-I]|nr:hypothetical protein BDV93DRAFT_259508 [Ceratobasidium sp. AG-I]
MHPRSLNVDTSRNLIWLDNSTHFLFDSGYWALVPTFELLLEIQHTTVSEFIYTKRSKFTKRYPHVVREYSFAQLIKLERPFIRFHNYPLEFSAHLPPFTSLSSIRSHIHPYFAICNVAQKDTILHPNLTNSTVDDGYETLAHDAELLARVRLCRTIYEMWISREPPADFDFLAPPDSHTSRSSSRSGISSGHSTTSRRSMPGRGMKRNRGDRKNNNNDTLGGGDDSGQLYEGAGTIPTDSLSTPGDSHSAGNKMDAHSRLREFAVTPYCSKVGNWLNGLEASTYPEELRMVGWAVESLEEGGPSQVSL